MVMEDDGAGVVVSQDTGERDVHRLWEVRFLSATGMARYRTVPRWLCRNPGFVGLQANPAW